MSSSERKKSITLDEVIESIGDFRLSQRVALTLFIVAIILQSAEQNAFVFTALNLNYRCKIPECETSPPVYNAAFVAGAIPSNDLGPEKCETYSYNFSSVQPPISCTSDEFDRSSTKKCNDFVYEIDARSILQEFHLQCENNEWKLTLVGTINAAGQLFGIFIGGLIADRFGRKFVLIWGMVLCAVFGLSRTLVTTYELFLVFEFLDALFGSSTYICGFVLGVELVGPKKRVLAGILISSSYAVGEVLTALAAWVFKSWKPIIYALYGPSLFLIIYIWIIPESVRWLLSKGRTDEAKAILRRAAKFNDKELSESTLEKLTTAAPLESDGSRGNLWQALKSRVLLTRLVVCAFCWMVCAFLFYGFTLNSVSLADGNPYLDFILTSLIEIPGYVCSNFMLDLFGRRHSLFASFLVTAVACAAHVFIPAGSYAGILTVFLIGKFGATLAFTNIYVHTSEMFPTRMRQTFMGICSTLGRIGSMTAPQTPLLNRLWVHLPMVTFAVLSAVAAVLSYMFPETTNIKLPDTIEEAENLPRSYKCAPSEDQAKPSTA